ncbi:hypothetical protein [Paludibacterium denitrificans]|uniref:hypothetical protein n=1 Tax=Paludibacterium denitrificans TaxID=2675226 RepID=UPI002477E1AE|nr:hypothetical protein [Paludibacterium denitrificans]
MQSIAQASGCTATGTLTTRLAESRVGQFGKSGNGGIRVATCSGCTPFCGPNIAVAPFGPVSGLLTSDQISSSASAKGESSAVIST